MCARRYQPATKAYLCHDGRVPRIDAPTLAEHRDNRRTALMQAGHDLMNSAGPRAVTMAAVAARAGLSRPAAYEYFASTADLLSAVVLEQMTNWRTEITTALSSVSDPRDRIRRYVEISLDLVTEGSHDIMALLTAETLPASTRRELGKVHAELAAPLAQTLHELGASDSYLATMVAQGAVEAASRSVRPDTDLSVLVDFVTNFIVSGVQTRLP